MSVPKHWILGGWYPRGLIVHRWRDRKSDSNRKVYFEFSFHFAFVVSLFQEHGAWSITFSIHDEINIRKHGRAIKNWKSRETGNVGYTRRRQAKQKQNTKYVGHHYTQANTNNEKITGSKDKPDIVFQQK